jgi:hypothetical protein
MLPIVRILVVLLAGCGFQVRAELIDAPADEGNLDPDAAIIDAGSDAPIDGMVDAMIDAAPMLVCPIDYTVTVPGSTSRYRISSSNGNFAAHHASCNDDMVGVTHLVVFDTLSELDQLTAMLPSVPQPSGSRFYVGAVQMMNQLTTSDGWLHFTGGAVPATFWGQGHPEDNDQSELDHDQQLAALDTGERMNDVRGNVSYGAICECDGKTIDPTVAAHIPP